MLIPVLLVFAFTTGLQAGKEDNRNVTVECSFNQVGVCFNKIALLGGNFSSLYAQKNAELNKTCADNVSPNNAFLSCLENVPPACTLGSPQPTIVKIENLVKKLCKNGSVEQNNFLNSSECYNRNINRRQHCVQQYATSKNDAKSLCCQSQKIQKCLKNDLLSVCSPNSTSFQNSLIDTYNGYTNMLCTEFNKHCGAAVHVVSMACLLLAVKTTFLARWQLI